MNGGNENKRYWAVRNQKSGECSRCMSIGAKFVGPNYHNAKKIGHRNIRHQVKQDLKQGISINFLEGISL